MSINITSSDPFISDELLDKNEASVKLFQKRIRKVNLQHFFELVDFQLYDGHHLEPQYCSKIEKPVLLAIGKHCISLLTKGLKIGQKTQFDNWKIGCFGSIWFDIDAKLYGLDYIRVAFYPKKDDETKDKIRIVCEKKTRST